MTNEKELKALDKIVSALEMQTLKQPIGHWYASGDIGYTCPTCDKKLKRGCKTCKCGQHIDWTAREKSTITHEDLVKMAHDNRATWACLIPCNDEGRTCKECAEELVANYENSLREEGKMLALKEIKNKTIEEVAYIIRSEDDDPSACLLLPGLQSAT